MEQAAQDALLFALFVNIAMKQYLKTDHEMLFSPLPSLSTSSLHQIPDDALSIQTVMVMIAFDTVLYMLLVWYIEGVWPGRYGVRKPLYFPFQPSYWLDRKTLAACKAWLTRERRQVRTVTLSLSLCEQRTMYGDVDSCQYQLI